MKRSTVLTATAASILLLSGCAGQVTKSELDEVRAMAQQAQAAAERAQQSADTAAAQAEAAGQKADQAMDSARDAQSCCDANTERLDRMFRKAMTK